MTGLSYKFMGHDWDISSSGRSVHYFKSDHYITKGIKVLRIEWKFASNIRTIHEEKLVYEGKYLMAWLGGALSIFIGLSFFDICSQIIDLILYYCQKRGKNNKKMRSCGKNIEEGNHHLTPKKHQIPCPNCNTQTTCATVRRTSIRKISQCSVELNCIEEPNAVSNAIYGPKTSMEQITGSRHSLYPNSPTLTVSQGYSPKRPHLRRKSSPMLNQPISISPKPSNSRRHSVDALEKGGFSKIPRHLSRKSLGDIQENVSFKSCLCSHKTPKTLEL